MTNPPSNGIIFPLLCFNAIINSIHYRILMMIIFDLVIPISLFVSYLPFPHFRYHLPFVANPSSQQYQHTTTIGSLRSLPSFRTPWTLQIDSLNRKRDSEQWRYLPKRAEAKIPFADAPHSGTQLHFSCFHHSILALFIQF